MRLNTLPLFQNLSGRRWGSPATPTRAPGSSRTSTTWSRRPSTTSTSGRSRSTSQGPAFTYAEAMAIARAAVNDPQSRLEPDAEDRTTPVGRRVGFATAVRTELDKRKRRLGILSYDDLLSQLRDALAARRRRRREDAAAAGRSCWSTSSRTPTRSSGRCSTARSPGTPRWC